MNDLAYLKYSNPDDKHEEKQQFFFTNSLFPTVKFKTLHANANN